MKLNKKVLIPVFATAMGLSVIGGITGAVAWYQYNSKVTTSFVGASVADTGVLQIGRMQKMVDSNGDPIMDDSVSPAVQKETIVWGRDFVQPDADHLIPVTFGAFEDVLDENNDPTGVKVLPKTAYSYPEAGCGSGYLGHSVGTEHSIPGWKVAEKGKDYAEFEVYFKAEQTDTSDPSGYKQVARDVFMSDYIFRSVADNKFTHEALRVYLEINDGKDGTFIFANKEYSDGIVGGVYDENEDTRLNLYGPLNLDRSNEKDANPNASENDVYHGTLWNDYLAAYGNHPDNFPGNKPGTDPAEPLAGNPYYEGEEIVYGNYGDKQATNKIDLMKETRGADGKMPENSDKKLFSTKEDEAVKVRVVIWLEGWEPMTLDGTDNNRAQEWNPYYSADTAVQVALQFDTGIFRGLAPEGDLNA